MHDDTAKNFSGEQLGEPNRLNRGTGPTSPEGKARSSMNRLTHGCRSERTVLPFEDPAEWEFTLQSWMQAYRALDARCTREEKEAYCPQAHRPSAGRCARSDEDPTASTLVFETARAQWIFQRNQQRLDETESGLPPDAIHWTEDHIKRYNNFLRYKTTAERSFYRAFNNLEAHYKRQAGKAAAIEKARAQMAKTQMQWLKEKAALAAKQQLCGRQFVEVVTNRAGECITTYAPTNEKLAEMLAARAQRAQEQDELCPLFVTRFVSFINGVPPAYEWLQPNDIQRYNSVMGVQQFTHTDWLLQTEAEQRTGHLEPVVRDSIEQRTGHLEPVVRDSIETLTGTGHLQPYPTGLLVDQ
jgi:hypothetical protein